MQKQLEMMNSIFLEVMNKMTRLRTKVASLQNELVCRDLKGRMPTRWDISPLEKFIAETTNKKAKDFDHDYGVRIQQLRIYKHEEFSHMIISSIEKQIGRMVFMMVWIEIWGVLRSRFWLERKYFKAYLEWERKVELIFLLSPLLWEKKVKLVVIEFIDYAIIWWDQIILDMIRNRGRPVET
jgi:hypothetical protein